MKSKVYEALRLIAQIIGPFSAFIAAICAAWGLPYAVPVAATLTGLEAFLAALVQILRENWKAKHPEIYQEEE